MASKRDDYVEMLGAMPDEEVAKIADVKPSTVAGWRKQLKIARFGDDTAATTVEDSPVDVDPPKQAAAPVVKMPAPSCVRALVSRKFPGPTGRTFRLDFRGIFRKEVAAWLWEHHRDLVERFPPEE